MKTVDDAIIGFGTAGKALALSLADKGDQVAVIEQSDKMYGGTCPNVACIPTKDLVHAAELSEALGGPFPQRMQRYEAAIDEKDKMVRSIRASAYNKLANHPRISVIDGTASFIDPVTLSISSATGTEELKADNIFIATGSRPRIPDIPGADGERVFTSDTLIDTKVLPRRLVIIGGGYIGMEYASMYRNFGSEVTVLQDGAEFLPREDRDIAKAVLESLRARGIIVELGANVQRIEDDVEQAIVATEIEGRRQNLPADAVLIAVGRIPNTDGLNAEAAGVQIADRGGVQTDDHLRAAMPHVWALGDARGKLQFTYIAYDDYRIVASDLLSDGSRSTGNRGHVPYAVFTDPPFSRVGLTEHEAQGAGHAVLTATLPAKSIARARIVGKPVGLLKAVVDADTQKVLGLHLFCHESPETVNLAKIAMDAGLPYTTLRDAIYTHPSMAEALNNLFSLIKEAHAD